MRLLSLLLALLFGSAAYAADNTVILTPGVGVTMRSIDVGSGRQSPLNILGDTSGSAIYGTAGTANANVLTIQGIASGTTVPVTGTLTAVTTVTTVSTLTGGGVASGAADSGNPVKVGGKYNASPITLTDGNRGDVQLDVNGYTKVNVTNANSNVANNSDAVAAGAGCCSPVTNYGYVWNGSTWDRQAGTTAGTKITAASGSIASGAVASGAVASGAYASGSLASGAMVDVTNVSTPITPATATATKGVLLGGQYNSTIPTFTNGQQGSLQIASNGALRGIQTNPYPDTAVAYTATATGTTGATTATLAGAASVTTYLCGFSIRANATAAATGNATVTGVITATLNFTQWTAPNASGLGITEMVFMPCIPASGTNQSVAVVSAAPGTGGVVSVTAWGYKL